MDIRVVGFDSATPSFSGVRISPKRECAHRLLVPFASEVVSCKLHRTILPRV